MSIAWSFAGRSHSECPEATRGMVSGEVSSFLLKVEYTQRECHAPGIFIYFSLEMASFVQFKL